MTTKFRKRHTLVDAVQLRWETWSNVCSLIDAPGGLEAGNPEGCYVDADGNVTDDTNGRIGLKIPAAGPPGTFVLAVENDWIVKDEAGKVFPLSPAAFAAKFEPAHNHDRYSVDYKPDWDRYPHLAKVFEHRPSINVYWDDLRALLVDARVDAVQYVQDVRAEELVKARTEGKKQGLLLGDALRQVLMRVGAIRTSYDRSEWERFTEKELIAIAAKFVSVETSAASVRSLNDTELEQALKNVGCDLECGGCAELFFTGTRLHEHTCPKGR